MSYKTLLPVLLCLFVGCATTEKKPVCDGGMIHKVECLPDRGHPGGWGVGQVDRHGTGGTATEVYGWRTNVLPAAQVFPSNPNGVDGVVETQ